MTPTPLSEQFPWVAQTIQAVGNGRNTDAVLAKTPSALRGGVQALAFHVLRQWAWAHAVVPRLASKKPDAELKVWLVCGVALLREPRRYDPHTVVDQVVQACKQNHRLKAKAPFVNACLRRLVREYDALDQAVCNEPEVRFNHPTWWIEKLQAQYPDHWEEALHCNQTAAPMVLRVNPAHHSAQSYQALLLSETTVQSVTVGPHGLLLAKPLPVTQLPGFGAGHVSVQDASPQLAAALVWQSPLLREKVAASAPVALLDACAAPGGKTAHLLEMGQRIKADQRVTALELSPKRAVRITDTLTRLNLAAFADVVVADGKHTAGWWAGKPFDAILLDAPCTASGIVRRHPDVPWLRRAADVAQLAQDQQQLLSALWPLLAPGGRLVYCTCSSFKEEGVWQIDAFLTAQPDAMTASDLVAPGHILPGNVSGNPNLLPDLGENAFMAFDGFFYAVLDKRAAS